MKARSDLALAAMMVFAVAGCGGGDMDAETAETATESAMESDPTYTPEGEATALPAGFTARIDREDMSAADFHVMEMGGGMHFETGPAGIFYNTESMVEAGDYTVSATFNEIGSPPNHREGYGLFFGGADLGADGQHYTYFLVRPTGHYLIKKRVGAETANVGEGWVASPAVNAAPEAGGDVTNELAVQVMGDMVHFSINGTEVAVVPAADVDAHGVPGVRINHNLNVMVTGFNVATGM